MEIRKATIKDFNELIGLKLSLKQEEKTYNKGLKSISDAAPHYKRYLKTDLTNKKVVVLVAVEEDEIVGMITIKLYRSLRIFGYRKRGYLSNLYVARKARRKGLGNKLTNEAIKWCKSKKVKEVTLEIYEKNICAVNLYANMGFKNYSVKMMKKV